MNETGQKHSIVLNTYKNISAAKARMELPS
jgi:hypothetical protein